MDNLYFSFLFVLRAVAKAEDLLLRYEFSTGNATDDASVKELVDVLVSSTASSTASLATSVSLSGSSSLSTNGESDSSFLDALVGFPLLGKLVGDESGRGKQDALRAADVCKHGFDESKLFQVNHHSVFHVMYIYVCALYA